MMTQHDPYAYRDEGGDDPYAAAPPWDPSADPAPHGALVAPGPGAGTTGPAGTPMADPAAGGYPYTVYTPPPSSGPGVTGFVLGLVSLTMCGLTAPIGIVFSLLGMRETAPGAQPVRSGRGLAIAGLVTSIIGMIPWLVTLAYIALFIVVWIMES